MKQVFLLSFLFAAVGAHAAPASLWVGYLEDGGVPVDGTISLTFTATDEAGNSTVHEEASLVVVDGNFVVEYEIEIGPDSGAFTASIIINGNDFGSQPLVTQWPAAVFVENADSAAFADDADALEGLDGQPALLTDLAAGEIDIALANVDGFPAPFLDGDQGIDLTPSPRFTFAGNAVSLADGSLTATQIQTGPFGAAHFQGLGAVGNVDLQDESLDASDFAATVPLAAIADGTLRAPAFSPSQNRTTIFKITDTLCANVGALSADSRCDAVDDCAGVAVRDCVSRLCTTGLAQSKCNNAAVGELVFK